jgi:23S rRNA pseudouridine2605 synthase
VIKKTPQNRQHREVVEQTTGLARALSKLGYCSRSQAWGLIEAGKVRVHGIVQRDAERRVDWRRDRIEVNGEVVRAKAKVYLMLNKPRGLVTTTSDEQGRATVFECLEGNWPERQAADRPPAGAGRPDRPRVFPVGRLDKASEGLLLFTNDTAWATRITAPERGLDKTYHVQVDCTADETLMRRMADGVEVEGESLAVKHVRVLRGGEKNCWLEIVLDEGKNRHIRRLLAALGVNVLRLVRVAIGPLPLGQLAKGELRELTSGEVQALARPSSRP